MTSNDPSPRSGDDTFDLIDEALATLAERRGCWLGDDLAAIALIASLVEQAERFLPQFVHDARAKRPHLARGRPCSGHQPRRRTTALRPRLTPRRQPMAPHDS
jgi:hypothetical protein